MLGDGVWEGLRVHKGKLAFLDRHLDRLFEGAKAIAMDVGVRREELAKRLYDTLDANGMSEGVHVRLMVTRGVRSTPYQDPRVVVTPATVVIIAEYKEPDPAVYERGLKLFTVHVRRGDPAVQDQKINSHSKLNCILASIQATQAGADEALMLDPHGFVATCNSTHFFIVRKGEVWTSSGKYCLGGVTRPVVLEVARDAEHTRARKGLLADRRLRRRRGVRHRHLRRHRPGARDRRTQAHLPRADGRPAAESSTPSGSTATSRSSRGRDAPHRDVVGSAKPLHGDDAQLRQPRRHVRFRRALLRLLPQGPAAPTIRCARR